MDRQFVLGSSVSWSCPILACCASGNNHGLPCNKTRFHHPRQQMNPLKKDDPDNPSKPSLLERPDDASFGTISRARHLPKAVFCEAILLSNVPRETIGKIEISPTKRTGSTWKTCIGQTRGRKIQPTDVNSVVLDL